MQKKWVVGDVVCNNGQKAYVMRSYPLYKLYTGREPMISGTQAELELQGWNLNCLIQNLRERESEASPPAAISP
jgi:hypothetical protein